MGIGDEPDGGEPVRSLNYPFRSPKTVLLEDPCLVCEDEVPVVEVEEAENVERDDDEQCQHGKFGNDSFVVAVTHHGAELPQGDNATDRNGRGSSGILVAAADADRIEKTDRITGQDFQVCLCDRK